jgi:accessory gene regulator protein AgrB
MLMLLVCFGIIHLSQHTHQKKKKKRDYEMNAVIQIIKVTFPEQIQQDCNRLPILFFKITIPS